MELDEEYYEELGYGGQRAYEVLAADMEYARIAYNRYMREYMRTWRRLNKTKYKEIRKRYRNSEKGKATTKVTNTRYALSPKGKAANRKSHANYIAKVKADPIKWADYLARKKASDKARYNRKKAARAIAAKRTSET